MKAITIKQPWASLIVEGVKDIENRTWKTNFRGTVLIHAGEDRKLDKNPLDMVFNPKQLSTLNERYTELQLCQKHDNYGVIIGSVEIVDCVINHPSIWAEKSERCQFRTCENCEENKHRCIYYNKPIYNWVLANPIKFTQPIPAKGKLSFWEFDIVAKAREMYSNGEIKFSELNTFEELLCNSK